MRSQAACADHQQRARVFPRQMAGAEPAVRRRLTVGERRAVDHGDRRSVRAVKHYEGGLHGGLPCLGVLRKHGDKFGAQGSARSPRGQREETVIAVL